MAAVASLAISIPVSAADIVVGFSPGDAETLIVRTIESAKKQILVAAYSFTDKPIARALLDAKNRGVDVKVVLDKSQKSEKYTAATFLANEGIPVRIDSKHAIMHNKYLVIDGNTVETGSFNYTSSAATRNAENAIVIRDDAALAARYARDWQIHWDHGQVYEAKY